MRLYVNDINIDLPSNFSVIRTKQVNDIGNISNRQSNYTRKIKVPKTKNNIKALDHLWYMGNTSRKPYQRNTVKLINDSGVHEILDGYAIVFESKQDYYSIAIYDGYISFDKAIENFTLTDLDISELNHLKNLTNVLATYTDDTLNYRYNLADYNGKAKYDGTKINIDYLIPSVNKKYLWDKIFDFFGFSYSGSVFETEDFINNWLTYPKSIDDGTQVITAIHTWNWDGTVSYASPEGSINFKYSDFFTHDPLVNNANAYSNGVAADNTPEGSLITVTETGLYKFTFSGVIGYAEKNGETTDNPIYIRYGSFASASDFTQETINDNFTYGDSFDFVFYKALEAGESFMIGGARPFTANLTGDQYTGSVDIDFGIVEGNSVDFEEAFIDFNIRDFVNEILWEFSLTPFKDKYSNNITFLTHEEWLQSLDNYNWSSEHDKFSEKIGEKYILKGYAQRNFLRHRYNESNVDYNDGTLSILNENLKESTTIIQSKIYTPEKEKSNNIGFETNVYKLWRRDLKDDGTIDYKNLDNRFYSMRSEWSNATITIGSETTTDEQTITGFYREQYDRLKFSEIVQLRYQPLYSILNTAKVITARIYFNDIDIINLDFKKLVYIKEEGSYFLINRIINYRGKGTYNVELIQVDYRDTNSEVPQPDPQIFINSISVEPNGVDIFNWNISTNYSFLNYTPSSATIYHKQLTGLSFPVTYSGLEYNSAINISNTNQVEALPFPLGASEGWYEVYIEDADGLQSNYEYVHIGNTDIVTPNIEVSIEVVGQVFNQDHERDVTYRFNNFTPANATLTVQRADFNTGEGIGDATVVVLSSLTADTDHTETDVLFPAAFGFYMVKIETDTINFQQTIFVY